MGNVCMSMLDSDVDLDEFMMIKGPYQDLLEDKSQCRSLKQGNDVPSHIHLNMRMISSGGNCIKKTNRSIRRGSGSSSKNNGFVTADETSQKSLSQDDLYVNIHYGGNGKNLGASTSVASSEFTCNGGEENMHTNGAPSSPTNQSRSNSTTSAQVQSPRRRLRSHSLGSESDTGDSSYGWFEDTDSPMVSYDKELNVSPVSNQQRPIALTDTPLYILETELENQKLWYETAGRRPKQPEAERKYFEKLWEEQLQQSKAVNYDDYNPDSITHNHSDTGRDMNNIIRKNKEEILYKGRGPFSNAVTKAFDRDTNSFELLTLQLPRFKIKKDAQGSTYCCYLVVIAINGTSCVVCFHHIMIYVLFYHSVNHITFYLFQV